MKSLSGPRAGSTQSGSALLLSFLVLIVLAAIIFQLYISTNTDARVARNDIALASMEQAIESALLEVYDRLESDAESSAGSTPTGDPSMADLGGAPPGEEDPGAAEAQSVDSREDPWGRPQRTTINDIELRVLVQDEDSKLNVLGILAEDQEQADEHFERLVRVIDLCREDTREDLDRSEARRLAEELRTHLTERMSTVLPKPHLLSDDDENEDLGLLLTLRECVVLDEFHEGLFRDFRDETGTIVHSLGTFLTVWTSLATHEDFLAASSEEPGEPPAAEPPPESEPPPEEGLPEEGEAEGAAAEAGAEQAGAGGAPGVAVNVNTAPVAVLKALIDDRDVPGRFWDEVIEYRNLEEEEQEDDGEPILDEYGEELFRRQVFDSLQELETLNEWGSLGPEERERVQALLSTQSQVFSIYVTARRATGAGDQFGGYRGAPPPGEQEDLQGGALVRTVASVVWRRQEEGQWQIVPLVRWDVLDYTPFEVQDYPESWR